MLTMKFWSSCLCLPDARIIGCTLSLCLWGCHGRRVVVKEEITELVFFFCLTWVWGRDLGSQMLHKNHLYWVISSSPALIFFNIINTRCKWHEENDILFCALAVCKKSTYCISNSLATLFGIQLTGAHVPLQDHEASNSVTPKMVVLDAGPYQVRKPLLLADPWIYITSLRENLFVFLVSSLILSTVSLLAFSSEDLFSSVIWR